MAIYKDWIEPRKLLVLRNWKRHGLTNEQIANNIGVSRQTLQNWIKKNDDIRNALKQGKDEAIAVIENKLFIKAQSGNLTAIIFWLKNNARDMYNDSQLSPEEREQAIARTKKLKADARISEARAETLEKVSNQSADKLDKLLDKLMEEGSKEDGNNRHSNQETK